MRMENLQSMAAMRFGIGEASGYAPEMAGSALEWSEEARGDATVLTPIGEVDDDTSSDFTDRLIAAAAMQPAKLVVDLAQIDSMSSRSLRALTAAQRSIGNGPTTIILARPNETVREILAISRYDMVFQVSETIEDALGT